MFHLWFSGSAMTDGYWDDSYITENAQGFTMKCLEREMEADHRAWMYSLIVFD